MKKQFLILVAAFLLLIGCSAVAAAEATTVATIGTAAYTSLQAAVDAYDGSTIRLEHTTDEAVSISKDVRLDLNGFDLTGAVTVTGGTLYALDSQTDDFTVNDEAGYGSVANVTGSIAAASDYLMIQESGSYSFHRVDLQIHTMTLRPEEAGVYYKSNFAGDEIVAANVDRYGIALSIKAVPSAENIKTACATSYFTGFSAGSNGEGTSTLLKNVMKTANTDAVNTAQAKMPVYGRAYILTNDGSYFFGEAVARTLQEQAEQVATDAVWKDLTDAQIDATVLMYRKYRHTMKAWKVSNIESALVLDKNDPLNDGKTLKVLALTSSFGLNTTQLLYDVAVAEGYAPENVIVGRLYASGCTLEKHLNHAPDKGLYQYSKVTGDPTKTDYPGVMKTLITEGNATLLDGLLDEDWDIIFMQQGAAQAPQLSTYKDYIDQFRAIVDQYKPNKEARFVWNMLWGYQSDSTISPFPTLFKGDQMYMYQCNIDAVMEKVVPRTDYDRIIPTGTVIQNARSSEFGDNLCRDTYHLNNYGAIMAAYGLFSVITGQEVTDIRVDAVTVSATNGIGGAAKITTPLTDTQKAIMVESVNNALKDPFHVTPSKYPYIDCSSYTYTENLSFFGDTNEAVCPECDQKVAWIEINQDNVESMNVVDGKGYFGSLLPQGTYHFYLSSDVSYTAASASSALLYMDGSNRNICLHLNGHNLTATNCSVAYLSSTSKLNIMGNGTVTGNRSNASQPFLGSAITLNSGTNGTNLGTIRLCSGTYVQPANSTQLAPIGTSWQAGLLQVLEDATITGKTGGYSICLNAANNKSDLSASYTERLEVYGGTLNGPIYCKAFSSSAANSSIYVYGGTLNDGIEIADSADITLSGSPVIAGNGLNLPSGMTVTLDKLTEGAKIKVKNTGAFTDALADAASYLQYFSPVSGDNKITVKNGALCCSEASVYTKNLSFETGTKNAYCAACDSTVTWIEINQDNVQSMDVSGSTGYFGSTMPEGTYHFYLSTDVSYTATAANKGNSLLHMATSRRNVCLHLNGHDLTATNCAIATLAGTAKLNILGTGTVIGNHTHSQLYRGSAIILNSGTTAANPGTVRLYSGTYVQPTGNTQLAPISTSWQGGKLEIYEDATLIGHSSSNSLCITSTNGNASSKYAETVNIYGGTFTRPVYTNPSSSTVTTPATALNISGGTFNNGIKLGANTDLTISGAPVISGAGLQLPEGTTVTLGEMVEGADIRIAAEGAFTAENSNAAAYAQYFTPAEAGYMISAKDNVLYCDPCSPYISNLVFETGTKNATCPACNKSVTWIEVNQTNLSSLLSNGTTGYFGNTIATGTYHFYLSSDVTYTAASGNTDKAFIYSAGSGRNICLHLNGNDLTCTNAAVVIMASTTKINIMGSGTVIGNHTHSQKYRGSAIIVNSGTSGTSWGGVSLYSGTYVQPADNTQLAPVTASFQGGHLDIYEDVTITGNASNYSVCLNTANNNSGLTASYDEIVNIYGGTFNRPLYAKSFSTSIKNTVLNISGGTFNDGIEIVDNAIDITLSGAPVISGAGLKLPTGMTVTLDSLSNGASVAVNANGAFTKAHSSAASFLQYFRAALSGYTVTAKDNVLYCNQG